MSLADEIKADLLEIESDLGNKVATIDGEDFPCSPANQKKGSILTVGGSEVLADLVLVFRREVFTSGIPAPKRKVSFGGQDYRIEGVSKNDAKVTLVLVNVSKGV